MSLDEDIKAVLKDGKLVIGKKRVKKALLVGKAKLVIVASNAPEDMKDDLERYASISGSPYYLYEGTSKDLGYTCAKPFPISSIAIIDEGGSNILDTIKG